ncbi:MAG: hypothetical protein JST79_02725 [Acidobacteria bacterium]|jgi:hypothetical protein|nr:hypothetical protein [Acidobacteriota bacterium]
MARYRLWAGLVGLCLALSGQALAQFDEPVSKNELSGLLGRTFISDQGVRGVSTFDPLLHFGKGPTFEINYGRRVLVRDAYTLTLEVPAVFDLDQKVHFSVNLAPRNYKSFFLTPSLRASLFPDTRLSPWISFGGGLGVFRENSTLEFGGANPGSTGSTTGTLQGGVGLDVRILRALSLRTAVRDFYSGVPQLNLETGKSRQHNYFVGVGAIWHF